MHHLVWIAYPHVFLCHIYWSIICLSSFIYHSSSICPSVYTRPLIGDVPFLWDHLIGTVPLLAVSCLYQTLTGSPRILVSHRLYWAAAPFLSHCCFMFQPNDALHFSGKNSCFSSLGLCSEVPYTAWLRKTEIYCLTHSPGGQKFQIKVSAGPYLLWKQ